MKSALEILLVEDNEGDVEMTQRALRDEACRLTVANDGIEALDYLFKRGKFPSAVKPQLIFLDLNMPRMNGKQLLANIKADEDLKTIPVVVLTSSQAPSDIQESYALHANGYVVKPFDGKEFINTVKQVVDLWRNLMRLPYEAMLVRD